jgi:ABC-type glycerol-3-phosphate transport system substrate-binding protein
MPTLVAGLREKSNTTLLSILWSYGGSSVAKDGETVTINSPETREAMEFVKRLYTEAMDPEVYTHRNLLTHLF